MNLNLILRRRPQKDGGVIGELYNFAGAFICFMLENDEKKIESGRYKVTITQSKRFSRPLPLINDVKGRSGIRIHPANYPHQLEGCLAPGLVIALGDAGVLESRTAFKKVYDLIDDALFKGDDVWLDVRNP